MEEIKKQIEKLEEELKTLKDKLEDTANDEWIPNKGDEYWNIDLDAMEVCRDNWINSNFDKSRLKHRVIFKTEEKADEYLEYLEEKEKHMNTFTEEEWENNNIDKWYYVYCYENKTIVPAYKICYKTNTSYFRTREELVDFIQKYEWQIKHELGVK